MDGMHLNLNFGYLLDILGACRFLSPLAKPFQFSNLRYRRASLRTVEAVGAFKLELMPGMSPPFRYLIVTNICSMQWLDTPGFVPSWTHKKPRACDPICALCSAVDGPHFPCFCDGPGRPGRKCNKQVRGNDNWLVGDMKDMLNGFGFPWIQVSFTLAFNDPASDDINRHLAKQKHSWHGCRLSRLSTRC